MGSKFVAGLKTLRSADCLPGLFVAPADWQRLRQRLYVHEGVVYAKPPLGGPEAVLETLGRYTHRVAVSSERILGIEGNDVLLRVRADPNSGKKRTLRVPGTEFIDRLMQHVLPAGFKRIRHYGLLSPARCPLCGIGQFRVVATLRPQRHPPKLRGPPG